MCRRGSGLKAVEKVFLTSFRAFDNIVLPLLQFSFQLLLSDTLVVQPVTKLVNLQEDSAHDRQPVRAVKTLQFEVLTSSEDS